MSLRMSFCSTRLPIFVQVVVLSAATAFDSGTDHLEAPGFEAELDADALEFAGLELPPPVPVELVAFGF